MPPSSEDFDPFFDWATEVAALQDSGYTFARPEVAHALDVAAVVSSLGWSGAREVLHFEWSAEEAELTGLLVTRILGERAAQEQHQTGFLMRGLLGGRRDH